jgi:hypothetical protein
MNFKTIEKAFESNQCHLILQRLYSGPDYDLLVPLDLRLMKLWDPLRHLHS